MPLLRGVEHVDGARVMAGGAFAFGGGDLRLDLVVDGLRDVAHREVGILDRAIARDFRRFAGARTTFPLQPSSEPIRNLRASDRNSRISVIPFKNWRCKLVCGIKKTSSCDTELVYENANYRRYRHFRIVNCYGG